MFTLRSGSFATTAPVVMSSLWGVIIAWLGSVGPEIDRYICDYYT